MRSVESIGERLKKARRKLGLTQKEFADLLGCSARAIQYWEKGEVKPRAKSRKKIEKVLETLLKEEYTPLPHVPSYFLQPRLYRVMSRIPAGYPAFVPSPVDLEESVLLPQDLEGNFIIKVEGNSMRPLLEEGEYAVVRPVYFALPEDLEGKVVVASVEGEFTIKRLVRKRKRFYLVPENPEYKPIPVNPDTRIIGIVVEAISRRKIT